MPISWGSHISAHCTSSFRKGQGCGLLPHVLLLVSGFQTWAYRCLWCPRQVWCCFTFQAGCKMNHQPCLLGTSQTHPHSSWPSSRSLTPALFRGGWWVPGAPSGTQTPQPSAWPWQRCFKTFKLSPLQWGRWSDRSLISFAEYVTGVAGGVSGFWWLCEPVSEFLKPQAPFSVAYCLSNQVLMKNTKS